MNVVLFVLFHYYLYFGRHVELHLMTFGCSSRKQTMSQVSLNLNLMETTASVSFPISL